ncbi:hypothetical protein HIM_04793 [Hirsutella minnesotensis 3608]|uniref:Tc1-like transposase DDE domain-containing protein n=1 Tax=Hirsutella minnesotensis 3608 TaxID=1043627 RepID=A0A0F8A5V1_9HYPO|nr:hypothetical protein HIM_04793 [Hirsutella minnesotensis 3608]
MIKRRRQVTYRALVGAMGGRVSRNTIRRAVRPEWKRKWLSIQRIPISKETAEERLQFARFWEGREEELTEVIFSGYTARSYRNALREGLLPVYDGTRRFQQDNARIHNFAGTPQWLQAQAIEYIDWPSHSPGLNPIEHAWRALKQKVIELCPHLHDLKRNAASIEELEEKLKVAWDALSQDLFDRLVESMPRRLVAVHRARGYYTKY